MNECKQNRKPITWLLLGTLDAKDAAALRAHLKDCADCREFFEKSSAVMKNLASAGPDPNIQAPAHFHRQLMGRLQTGKPVSAWNELLAGLGRMTMNWRVVAPGMIFLLLAVVLLVLLNSIPVSTVSSVNPPTVPVAVATVVNDPAPTAVNYQLAAAQSLSKLDELLTREGNESLPPAPVYTASTRLPDNAF